MAFRAHYDCAAAQQRARRRPRQLRAPRPHRRCIRKAAPMRPRRAANAESKAPAARADTCGRRLRRPHVAVRRVSRPAPRDTRCGEGADGARAADARAAGSERRVRLAGSKSKAQVCCACSARCAPRAVGGMRLVQAPQHCQRDCGSIFALGGRGARRHSATRRLTCASLHVPVGSLVVRVLHAPCALQRQRWWSRSHGGSAVRGRWAALHRAAP